MRQAQELRKQTLTLVQANNAQNNPSVSALLETWLSSLEEDDLAGILPASLASMLWEGFTSAASWTPAQGCQINAMAYQDGRGGRATALLILNPDMPYLVDSIVMALRSQRVVSRAVLNSVLAVQRDAAGKVLQVEKAKATKDSKAGLESIVVCLLTEQIKEPEITSLLGHLKMSVGDAADVRHDAPALSAKMLQLADEVEACANDGKEAGAFLRWADNIGFETFGYVSYQVQPETRELVRDVSSALGVLKNRSHPIYGNCLKSIPGDFDTLFGREHTLSVVKADVQATLYRDQQLDFIGVRNINAQGVLLGEHCLVGLFSRAATATALADLPFARVRIAKVLQMAGVRPEGFRAEKFLEILESLPRVEVLEAQPEWLAEVSSAAVALFKQPRAKVFARRDVYGRHLNVLVYMPRELYSANLAETLADTLQEVVGASSVRVETLLADGPLARLYLIAKAARPDLDLENDIQLPLLGVLEGWHTTFNNLVDSVEEASLRVGLRKLCSELPADYIAVTSPVTAYHDLSGIMHNAGSDRIKVRVETTQPVSIRLQSLRTVPALSNMLPAMHNAGVVIEREQTYQIAEDADSNSGNIYVTCLSLDEASAEKLMQPGVAKVAQELFESLLNNEAEDGRMNALVIEAGMRSMEVQVIRAYASYWRQAGCRFSIRYMADCLKKQAHYVRQLTDAFLLRFDPTLDQQQREAGTAALHAIIEKLTDINHADSEDILRTLAELMLATLRTSYFQSKQLNDIILFKFDTTKLSWLPQPRPFREIFVFSRRFEGVHLRGGPVARGGLRWSDRMEDYRTEVLGLVKAQMVKNAVIVPAGAKGGFVCKMVPKDTNGISSREMVAREGEAVYRLFIAGLLDLTDNRQQGKMIHPEQTVCYDDADPYLVVAADKGTATFSDIANGIAVERGFWLGDAFASGGSNGYDHKKLGITAKGAWEAVKRHFYELGHDLNTTPITMTGVGDMSGDVFGNGLLLSRQIKLVAAFDHRHIFIDPTPDVKASFEERQRMFALPRSSWEDYNKMLISAGGGVYPRDARSITLSLQAQQALHTEAKTVTPEQLLHIILMANVDLFYNGGIGTYIKASTESHAQVKDRANDAIRVDGNVMRCKVVAEGGNLGATQAGRIEFALKGGRIFTDAIDNSAGVDCSDHEVNVKIWLDSEVNAGMIDEAERNSMLNKITLDIEDLVLRDNTQQTRLLVREEQAQHIEKMQDAYANLVRHLEAEGVLSRELEQLPTELELARRKEAGIGLTAPELAVVVANVKNRYKGILSGLPLTGNSWAKSMLTPYFPAALVATRNGLDHPLANPILGTVLANEAVNRCGPIMLVELAEKYQVAESEVILAWSQAWAALNLAPLFDTLDAHALLEPRDVSKALDERCRLLQRSLIEGVLSVPKNAASGNLAELTALFSQQNSVAPLLSKFVTEAKPFPRACQTVEALIDMADFLFSALGTPRTEGLDLAVFLQIGLQLRQQSGIAQLEPMLMQSNVTPLRTHALNALRRAQQRLLELVLLKMPKIQDRLETEQLICHINAVLTQVGIQVKTVQNEQPSLETAVLEVWALSEAATATSMDCV
ncbi:NAD-glutamate dehydrogenase domain-containing protein [Solimicrobium silvestre]|uniref:NAD-specific glutamate dehydrogenase n=1 Tax=Solimicrobium silvestre TaxID=2099400 RepID=A0A2S9H4B5_9BURK|nr:NAD-glutamate dehydrogenase domain-containing protein [Solimicrobium silvestre]PRC94808.1 NAD-specific glutamate dehydrogenase [Solimicrobium silvestre]